MDLGQKIVSARKQKGLTQEQLAELTNITVRTIQRIENGQTTPRAYTLKTIAAALDTSFEELNAGNADKQVTQTLPAVSKEEDSKHFLQMLCLSCFSYLVVPFVHFLVPGYILRKSNEQNPAIIAFARKLIRVQVYWKVILWGVMLLTVAYNIIMAVYFEKSYLLNYLLPFFVMYIINAVIISVNLIRIKRVGFSFQPAI